MSNDLIARERFVYETNYFLRQRLKILIPLVLFSVLIAVLFFFTPYKEKITIFSLPSVSEFGEYSPSPFSLLVIGFFGGLFFFPLPQELFYAVAVKNGGPWFPLLLGVLSGFVLANVVNYVIGWKLNSLVVPLVSPSKLYGIRRWVGRYGAWAVLVINILPVPSPLLTFALGIMRYNTTRLFLLLTVGNIIKFLIIAGFLAQTL